MVAPPSPPHRRARGLVVVAAVLAVIAMLTGATMSTTASGSPGRPSTSVERDLATEIAHRINRERIAAGSPAIPVDWSEDLFGQLDLGWALDPDQGIDSVDPSFQVNSFVYWTVTTPGGGRVSTASHDLTTTGRFGNAVMNANAKSMRLGVYCAPDGDLMLGVWVLSPADAPVEDRFASIDPNRTEHGGESDDETGGRCMPYRNLPVAYSVPTTPSTTPPPASTSLPNAAALTTTTTVPANPSSAALSGNDGFSPPHNPSTWQALLGSIGALMAAAGCFVLLSRRLVDARDL